MHKKIWTADEEIRGVGFMLIFTIIWYSGPLRIMMTEGFQNSLLIFLIAGLMMPYQIFKSVQKAVYHRNLHKQCMQESYPQQGRITNIVRESFDNYDSNNRRRRISYYFLIIEVVHPETGIVQTIKSEPYRIPIYKYLGSPHVQVYTDKTGWKHVIDGFQLKAHRNGPDIPLENSNVYLKDFNQPTPFFRFITGAILILMLLQILGILR